MPQSPLTAKAQKNLLLEIGADSYEKHVSDIAWVPSTSQMTWQGGTPDATAVDSGPTTWVSSWTVVQDWQNEDALCNFLLDHEGEVVTVHYKPDADGTFEISADVTLAAPQIGGAVNAINASSVTMPSTKPERVTP